MNRKVLITGGNGLLGSELSLYNIPGYDIKSTSINNSFQSYTLDITKSVEVKEAIENYRPEIIINCAAYTNVDNTEINKELAHNVNVNGLKNLIKYSTIDTKIVHISTDYVFDGKKSQYRENDITRPVNY